MRKNKITILNKEALRVVKNIPEWSVYYRNGKVERRSYRLPVAFDEETRQKYVR